MMNRLFALLLLGLLSSSAIARSQNTAGLPVPVAAPAEGASPAETAAVQSQQASGINTAAPAKRSLPGVGPDYVLAPEDSITITVWKEPALSGTVPIRPDGMISLALLGDLPAAGSTPMRLGNDIAIRLKKYVTDPRVTVTVMNVHVDKVFMLGEVGHVGPIPLSPDMTALQAISAAGGLTQFANAKHIYILRKQGGQERRIPFNYKKALKNGDEQGVSLLAGDTIVVP